MRRFPHDDEAPTSSPPSSVGRSWPDGQPLVGSAVRARHMKTILESVDALGALAARHIRARVRAESLRAIDEAPPSAWLPLDVNVELTHMIAQTLGKPRTQAFFRNMVLREYETSLFKSFIATFTRLLGLSPMSYVKMTPKGWTLVFRDCGRLTPLDIAEGDARLLFDRIPEICLQGEVWLDSVRSSFCSSFDICQVAGSVEFDELDLAHGRAVFHFRWHPRA